LDVTLAAGTIRVERTLDDGETHAPGVAPEPKTAAGRWDGAARAGAAAAAARAHQLATGRGPAPGAERKPRGPRHVWVKARDDALGPIDLHESLQAAASLLIASGVNITTVSAVMVTRRRRPPSTVTGTCGRTV
jgi:hypothetical protein